MRMDRRHALAVLSGLAAAGLTGCGGDPPLRIAVVWSGWELGRFNRVLQGQSAVVYSAGDNIAALLGSSVAPAATPDVAIVPRPGLINESAVCARLQSLPSGDPPFWQDLMRCGADGTLKGAWFKVAHKSLVWYRPEAVPTLPTDWESWVELCRDRARAKDGRPPLAIAAADGWVLTDWFENVLLGLDPATYSTLHRKPESWGNDSIRKALNRLADLWSIRGLVPGGGRQALVTQFHDSILDVFRYGSADMLAAPDFAWPVIDHYRSPGQEAWRFRFPGPRGHPAPRVVVGGDAVVALESSGDRGRRFVEWLTGEGAGERLGGWAAAGGFLSLNQNVRGYPAPIRDLVPELSQSIEFDLSDRLTGPLSGGDGQGLWRVLTELFVAVAVDGQAPEQAADDAMRMIAKLIRRGRPS
ncbi:ABC-type glycerol-3-phosphate transport system substrate-binding protein [Streptosporangium album]|uniref:ABC-type glycerol-3-phosphate transport system substrate-binding protein n=1 Tax=Streptosporangium album TaxID=47479 RepID=A0A7W7S4T3_9ACTN|nr:ABC transporter substrate-binding protein [Streptosporangium album]MBB4943900.1 ABC-type glycerol-3-phosphate transport system substrate-binding protein [Streptosporangium album]